MKKLPLITLAALSMMGAVALADSPTFSCPAANSVHPIEDSATPGQYNYAAVDISGAGVYVSFTMKHSPVAVTSFHSADLLHDAIFSSITPSHCYYRLADGSIMGLHSVSAAAPWEQFVDASSSQWVHKGQYDHCVGNQASQCAWNIKIVNPSQQQ